MEMVFFTKSYHQISAHKVARKRKCCQISAHKVASLQKEVLSDSCTQVS